MHLLRYTALAGAAALTLAGWYPTPAAAQRPVTFRAQIMISITDPATKASLIAPRLSLRSWPRKESCEREASKISAPYQLGQVEGFGLVTPSGASPVLEVKSVECFQATGEQQ